MFESPRFPKGYEYIDVVWLYEKTDEGVCPICWRKASYIIHDEEGCTFKRCSNCFEELLRFRKILLVEKEFWDKKFSKDFHGLRKNPKPSENLPKTLEAKFITCDVCGCRFVTEKDFESHYNAWHKPGGIYFLSRSDEKNSEQTGQNMEKIHENIMEK